MTGAKDHKDRSHALLSASGSHRWLNCTPSAVLEEKFGKNETSVYAQEGTLAHEMAEAMLRRHVTGTMTDEEAEARLAELRSDPLYKPEMDGMLPTYVDYCSARLSECGPLSEAFVEERLDFSRWVPGSFGTGDFGCCDPYAGKAYIVDLKWGKGVRVSAEDNPQGKMYALGLVQKYRFFDIREVTIAIVQPRLDSISEWKVSVAELLEWANGELRAKAELASTGSGELRNGGWCQFCAVAARCPKLRAEAVKVFDKSCEDIKLCSEEEVADTLSKASSIRAYLDKVEEYATDSAYNGEAVYPGFKVVRANTVRKWGDKEEALKWLAEMGIKREDALKPRDIRPIGEIEKMLPAPFKPDLAKFLVKPEGAPTIVPETDKREPISASGSARRAFKGVQ